MQLHPPREDQPDGTSPGSTAQGSGSHDATTHHLDPPQPTTMPDPVTVTHHTYDAVAAHYARR